ncbi:MAG: putative toxin-antitoxin system toxin component, PIN family [Armatimonadota bacterium]|nr:putative toxin-antitoxin system toxin component, PIN family [Armatimonadota bacterium]
MRAVVDTNVWISALLNPHDSPASPILAFRDGLFEAVASEPLFSEIKAVLRRPRIWLKYQLDEDTVAAYLALIRQQVIWVEPTGSLHLCRDPRDDFLLETAIWGDAQYIVTRDDDLKRDPALLQQLSASGIKIVSVQHFLDLLSEQSP